MKSMLATAVVVLAVSEAALVVHPVSVVAQQPMGNGMSSDQMQMMHQQMVPGSQTSDATMPLALFKRLSASWRLTPKPTGRSAKRRLRRATGFTLFVSAARSRGESSPPARR